MRPRDRKKLQLALLNAIIGQLDLAKLVPRAPEEGRPKRQAVLALGSCGSHLQKGTLRSSCNLKTGKFHLVLEH